MCIKNKENVNFFLLFFSLFFLNMWRYQFLNVYYLKISFKKWAVKFPEVKNIILFFSGINIDKLYILQNFDFKGKKIDAEQI